MRVLQQILAIKAFRESRAEQAFVKQRGIHRQAEEVADLRAQELEAFRVRARQREDELFGGLVGRTVRLAAIQDMNLEVDDLRAQDRRHVASAEKARDDATRERELMDQRRTEHTAALQLRERFSEIVDLAGQEAAAESDRREDSELEEVAEIRSGRAVRLHGEEEAP